MFFLARFLLCQPAYVPHGHSIMCHACTCKRVLGLPCLALPCLLNRHGHEKKSAMLLNKYREQEALGDENEVLDSKSAWGRRTRCWTATLSMTTFPFNQLQFLKSFTVQATCPFGIAKHARIRRWPSLLLRPKKLRVDGLNNEAVSTICTLLFYSDLFACRSVALYLGQFVSNRPSMEHINSSEIMTIDTYCGPQSVGFGAYR